MQRVGPHARPADLADRRTAPCSRSASRRSRRTAAAGAASGAGPGARPWREVARCGRRAGPARGAARVAATPERRDQPVRRPRRSRAGRTRRAGGLPLRRRPIAVRLEVIDQRGLEPDHPRRRARRRREPGSSSAPGQRSANICSSRRSPSDSRNSRSRDAGGERDVVGDDNRRRRRASRTCSRISRASMRTRCGSSPTDGSSRNSSLRRLASTRATATRWAWPPDSRSTGDARLGQRADRARPGAATRGIPGRGVARPAVGVAQRELEVAADVEVIEQRAALRDEPELTAIEGQLRRRPPRSRRASSSSALEQHPRERGLAGAACRRAAPRPRPARPRASSRRSGRGRRGGRPAARAPRAADRRRRCRASGATVPAGRIVTSDRPRFFGV